jgi:hypothetical protein
MSIRCGSLIKLLNCRLSSLCYGDIHPDAILSKEKHIKAAEKAHHIDLHNYHSKYAKSRKSITSLQFW